MAFGAESGHSTGSVKGYTEVTSHKVWDVLNGLGTMAFAYSFSFVLVEIQVLSVYTSLQCQHAYPTFICLYSTTSTGVSLVKSCCLCWPCQHKVAAQLPCSLAVLLHLCIIVSWSSAICCGFVYTKYQGFGCRAMCFVFFECRYCVHRTPSKAPKRDPRRIR